MPVTIISLSSNALNPQIIKKSSDDIIAKFSVQCAADVFITMDTRIVEKPVWLKDYSNTGTKMRTDDLEGGDFHIYGNRFSAGDTIQLGQNGILSTGNVNMYTVVVYPVTGLDDAFDQRPKKRYEAEKAQTY